MKNNIQLLSISIKNFFSVGDTPIEVMFDNGITLIYGVNKDATSTKNVSNGAGKTTIVNGVYQCLFNRNLKDVSGKITGVSNKYTGKGYSLELILKVGKETYTIINSRETGELTVYNKGIAISPKGINATLKFIEELIGFDFNSFSGLTFLNQDSLGDIIDLTNENNVVNRFFDLNRAIQIQTLARARRKEISGEYRKLEVETNALESDKLKLLQLEGKTSKPVSELLSAKEALLNKQESLTTGEKSKLVSALQVDINTANVDVAKLQKQITELVTTKNGFLKTSTKLDSNKTCPLCHSELHEDTHKDTTEYVKAKIASIDAELVTVRRTLSDRQGKLDTSKTTFKQLNNELTKEKQEIAQQLTQINLDINTSNALKEASDTIGNLADVEESIKANKEILSKLNKEDEVLLTLDKLIKKGDVLEVYLRQYTRLLTANLSKSSLDLSMSLKILPTIVKGNISFSIIDGKEVKSFSQLSSGERTRVSLLILMATLKSLSQLSGVNINLLNFDELLGVLDDDGISLVKNIINREKSNMSIWVINHHDEIDKSVADRLLFLCKENNITTVCKGE